MNAELASLQDHPFTTGPYLIALEPGRVAVVLKHELPEPPAVEWWVEGSETSSIGATPGEPASTSTRAGAHAGAPRATTRVLAEASGELWIATLGDLPIDQPLAYRVRSAAGDAGPFTFHAGVSRGRPFRFAAFGDTRTGHGIHRALIEAMAREPADFVINSGDLVEFGGTEEQWDLFFRIEAPLIASRPVLAAIGNHDVSPRGYFDRFFLSDRVNDGHRYFSLDWGDVRVLIMDSEIEARRGSDQYAFLEAKMRDGAERGMLMVVSLHYPPYSSGEHGSNLEMREVLGELAPRFGVELVLAGHDHNYERTHPVDGVTYIVAASAGATIRKLYPSSFSAALRTEPHFVLFDVDRGSLVGRAINLYGDTFDTFVIPPNPPRDVHR